MIRTQDRSIYRCHKVSSLDSPRTNKENIDALIKKYGVESNVVRVRVLGEFPCKKTMFLSRFQLSRQRP